MRARSVLLWPRARCVPRQPDERRRSVAYELGRDAVTAELSVLDLAVAHHDALEVALASADDAPSVVAAAGDFFLEALAAYEMVQRGYREAQEAAAVERRQAELLRQLSNFLADASLALETWTRSRRYPAPGRAGSRADACGPCRVTLDMGFDEPWKPWRRWRNSLEPVTRTADRCRPWRGHT